jgi:FixJ family two-component response regulator
MMALSNESPHEPWSIAVVDDEPAVLRSLTRLLLAAGCTVNAFSSSAAFLQSLHSSVPEVALVDLCLPDIDGLALLSLMRSRGHRIPVVFLSGHGDVPTSVRAIRDGAIDFLEKPCDEEKLIGSLARAIPVSRGDRATQSALREVTESYRTLTPREREVFAWVVTGRLNKQIAAALGTTEKTVKVHRSRVMTKMGASSVVSLVRMFDALDVPCPAPRTGGSLRIRPSLATPGRHAPAIGGGAC